MTYIVLIKKDESKFRSKVFSCKRDAELYSDKLYDDGIEYAIIEIEADLDQIISGNIGAYFLCTKVW